MMLTRLLTRAFRFIENLETRDALSRLRKAGHAITADLSLGRRVHLDIAPDASVSIAPGVEIMDDSWIIAEPGDALELGENVFVSHHCTISGSVRIGADTLVAAFVTILDANHVLDDPRVVVRLQGGRKAPIRIGRDVWIGAHAVILPGISIGDHAVIGANSTVTRDVPDWAIVGGSPAKIIREREH